MKIKDRHFVISGASSGIGAALAEALAARGARLSIGARRAPLLEAVAERCRERGAEVFEAPLDVRDAEGSAAFCQGALNALGPCHGLINNAGRLGPRAKVIEQSTEELSAVLEVNVLGLYRLTRELLPSLLEANPGVVLNLSSGLGRFGVARSSAYCASKFAVEGLSQSLADEHPGEQLVVLTVAPGMVVTDMLRAYLEDDDLSPASKRAAEEPEAPGDLPLLSPEESAAGMVRILEGCAPGWTGRALDVAPYLSP